MKNLVYNRIIRLLMLRVCVITLPYRHLMECTFLNSHVFLEPQH